MRVGEACNVIVCNLFICFSYFSSRELDPIPVIQNQLASKRFLELDSSFDSFRWKDEYRRIFSAGAEPVMDAAVSAIKAEVILLFN